MAYYFVTWIVSHFPFPLDLSFNALTYGKLACLKNRNKQGKKEEEREGGTERERQTETERERRQRGRDMTQFKQHFLLKRKCKYQANAAMIINIKNWNKRKSKLIRD